MKESKKHFKSLMMTLVLVLGFSSTSFAQVEYEIDQMIDQQLGLFDATWNVERVVIAPIEIDFPVFKPAEMQSGVLPPYQQIVEDAQESCVLDAQHPC